MIAEKALHAGCALVGAWLLAHAVLAVIHAAFDPIIRGLAH